MATQDELLDDLMGTGHEGRETEHLGYDKHDPAGKKAAIPETATQRRPSKESPAIQIHSLTFELF